MALPAGMVTLVAAASGAVRAAPTAEVGKYVTLLSRRRSARAVPMPAQRSPSLLPPRLAPAEGTARTPTGLLHLRKARSRRPRLVAALRPVSLRPTAEAQVA